jgi:hypothetical protein
MCQCFLANSISIFHWSLHGVYPQVWILFEIKIWPFSVHSSCTLLKYFSQKTTTCWDGFNSWIVKSYNLAGLDLTAHEHQSPQAETIPLCRPTCLVEVRKTLKLSTSWAAEDRGCQMVCFQTKKSQFGQNWEGLRLENVYIFYGYLEYFMEIWDILWSFGTFCIRLVHFFPVLVSCSKKNLATLLRILKSSSRAKLWYICK